MPNIKVNEPFLFSPDGIAVIKVEAGEQEVSERCAVVAVEHLKVATLIGAAAKKDKQPAEQKK